MTAAFNKTIQAQRAAAAPFRSAFVSANAGAGKTRVLTDRVARLLLNESAPSQILCITFTKAAAAEMAERLFSMLGKWALADDEALTDALQQLEGDARTRTSAELARARTLFAQALETPGGLKIQTIHAFCESVLRRFPLEAGVAPGFTVIEDGVSSAMINAAIDDAAANGDDAAMQSAIARLTSASSPALIRDLLSRSMQSRQSLTRALQRLHGWSGLVANAALVFNVEENASEQQARAAQLAAADATLIARAHEAFLSGMKNARALADGPMRDFLEAQDSDAKLRAAENIYFTKSGGLRSKFGDKQTQQHDPSLTDALTHAQQRFFAAKHDADAVAAYLDTRAYLDALQICLDRYNRRKQEQAALDFDDLLIAADGLFAKPENNAWVMYKLDAGLDHILLDEAQDTSPAQWDIIEGPLREFIAGDGAKMRRTFFAVGDQKQSIYSFQGADAALFPAKQIDLGSRIAATDPEFKSLNLQLSFRTTEPVLRFVDALFADESAIEGVSVERPMRHDPHRMGEAGLVEAWPPTPHPDKCDSQAWDAPVDMRSQEHPVKTLCDHIARTIAGWLKSGEVLKSRDRPVAASDVMILVQSRSALFHQMIASLSRAGVPVAGADKLKLFEDPAVEDLLAFARVVLAQTDDLSLAELLKSPFFGWDDEQLFAVAYDRAADLWRALSARAVNCEQAAKVVSEIDSARRIAEREGAYGFFSHILETGFPSGRKRLYARLGLASKEPIDELLRQSLEFESSDTRSLQGFIAWTARNAGEIKREQDQAHDMVRVMTVHGAKGLESEIVFLLDAHRTPDPKNIGPIFDATPNGESGRQAQSPIFIRNKDAGGEVGARIRSAAKRADFEEYRRLLYVAATRARDRLYICGVEKRNDKNADAKPVAEQSWHALTRSAFARLEDATRTPHEAWPGDILRIQSTQTAAPRKVETPNTRSENTLPDWLFRSAPVESAPRSLAPSRLADHEEAQAEHPAQSPLRPVNAFFRGRVLHKLLEVLPEVAPTERASAADTLLLRLAPATDVSERAEWREEALRVLDAPAFAAAFAPGSKAEVAIAGHPAGARDGVVMTGQIDRLSVTDQEVLIVDYKTNRPPPKRAEDVSPAYLSQMAAYRALLAEIYPGRKIRAALLWTYEARLTELPEALLDHAFARNLS